MRNSKFIAFVIIMFSLIGCGPHQVSSNEELAMQTEQAMQEANRQIGMPAIVNFQERKLAKMIFELRDQADLITYTYLVNKMTGKLVFLGRSIGYGLPYSVQYTNPETIERSGQGYGYAILPQADPNGLFMPTGLSATWIMLLDPKTNKPKPVYVEPEIVVSPFKLH